MSETTPNPAPRAESERSWDRVTAALAGLGATIVDLIRRGNRRRVTLRGRDGSLWIRVPLTLAALVALLAVVYWLPFVVLAIIAMFVFGVQVSVDRQVADAPAAGDSQPGPGAPPSTT